MNRITAVITAMFLCVGPFLGVYTQSAPAEENEPASVRVLLITGEDYAGHKWQETYPVLKRGLEKDARLKIDVLTDLKQLATVELSDYQAAIVHFKNYDPKVPGRKGLDNLTQFVKNGGGLMFVHFGCGAFEEFKDDFERIAGRVWFGAKPPPERRQHDPRGKFTVNIANASHPITKGMKDFTTIDELYTCLEGDSPITVVATAISKVDKKPYPIAFVTQCGKGRVFHSVLGHDTIAFEAAGPTKLHRRGCAWVAGLDPARENE